MQISSAILFRVLLFNGLITEKDLSLITNMGSTSSAKNLLSGGNCPFAHLVVGLVTLQLFQNCFPKFPWYFPYFFS